MAMLNNQMVTLHVQPSLAGSFSASFVAPLRSSRPARGAKSGAAVRRSEWRRVTAAAGGRAVREVRRGELIELYICCEKPNKNLNNMVIFMIY